MPSQARVRYDWATWSDGNWWILRPGEDFPADLPLDELHDRAYVYAYRHGLRAHLERHNGGEACQHRDCEKHGLSHPEETGRFVYVCFTPRAET